MTDTKPTLEEQIAAVINEADVVATACVAGADEPLRAAAKSLKELAAIKEQIAQLMIKHTFATGHGDTASDMLLELDAQLTERYQSIKSLNRTILQDANDEIRARRDAQPTPRTDAMVAELYEDAAMRKKAPIPARDPFDRALELCYILERELAAIKSQPEQCEWRISDELEGDTWDGRCGVKWTFTDGGPVENDMRYCPNCGKTLVVSKERK